jgi:1-acyl-sn-glycerol-3-phosphate acyltransferase
VADVKWLGKLVGSPAFPITPTFPWLGLAGFLPLPVKFRIRFGEPLRFEGDANEDDAAIEKKVTVVKKEIRKLLGEARAERQGWFS